MFSVPTAMRLLKQADPEGKYSTEYDLSSLRHMALAGEHLDIATKVWSERIFGLPVGNNWWQTETGSTMTGTCQALKNPCKDTDLTTGLPFPGFDCKYLLMLIKKFNDYYFCHLQPTCTGRSTTRLTNFIPVDQRGRFLT